MNPDDSASHSPPPGQTQQGTYSHRLSDAGVGGGHQRFRMGDDFFRQVVESLEDYVIFTTDTEGMVSSWNGAAERLLGYSEGEMIGRPAALLYTAEDQRLGSPAQELRTARDHGQSVGERQYQRGDGSRFWARGKVFALLDGNSTLRGFTVILRDVTESRQARIALTEREFDLQRLNDKLALANEELATTNEELAAANEEIHAASEVVTATNDELSSTNAQLSHLNVDLENFVYTASHDLKAPILNIEGLLRVLLKKLPAESLEPEPIRKIIGLIDNSVERFKHTIGSLMEIARLQHESDQPVTEIDLARVVGEVQLDLSPLVAAAGAQLDVSLDNCPTVRFAEKHLRSVVYNFLSNAIKYAAPQRPPCVRVRCQAAPGYVVLLIEDNGLGMDLRKGHKLFSLFHRLHDHVEGSGIGLYMVKKILENAGGKVEVESAVGQGSTFRAYFRA